MATGKTGLGVSEVASAAGPLIQEGKKLIQEGQNSALGQTVHNLSRLLVGNVGGAEALKHSEAVFSDAKELNIADEIAEIGKTDRAILSNVLAMAAHVVGNHDVSTETLSGGVAVAKGKEIQGTLIAGGEHVATHDGLLRTPGGPSGPFINIGSCNDVPSH